MLTTSFIFSTIFFVMCYSQDLINVRKNCYPDVQPNCNEEFTDKYPNVSMSMTNFTRADTWFWLFTRRNKQNPELLHKCGGQLPPNSHFNPKKRLIVIPIAFNTGYCDTAMYREWTAQLLIRDDYNILVVDYTWGNRFLYHEVVSNVYIVAHQTVIVLRNIQEQTGITGKTIQFIGHSLGAQISGIVGGMFHVFRITALDPARPGFTEDVPISERLDATDADLVDAWHCNAGKCLPNDGVDYDVGHADFYINGGSKQESCYPYTFESFLKGDFIVAWASLTSPSGCYHVQCGIYCKVSINPVDCQFVGVECDNEEDFDAGKCNSCGADGSNCTIMGMDWEKYASPVRKRYFVKTTLFCDYCDNSDMDLGGFASTYWDSLNKTSSE